MRVRVAIILGTRRACPERGLLHKRQSEQRISNPPNRLKVKISGKIPFFQDMGPVRYPAIEDVDSIARQGRTEFGYPSGPAALERFRRVFHPS